jgi:hypothetical protein
MTPITFGIQVTKIHAALFSKANVSDRAGNFTRHKGPASPRTLVIKENTIASIDFVGFAIVHRDPIGVQLGDTIRRARVEWRSFRLRSLDNLTVELRC